MIFLPVFSSLLILLAESKSEIKINTNVNSVKSNISVSTETNVNSGSSVKINNNEFEIEGKIDSVLTNSFTVNGQSISIDAGKIESYKQKGILEVENQVKVKGTIKNGILYAEDIKIISDISTDLKVDVKEKTVSPNTSLTESPAPTASASVEVKVKSEESENLVVQILQQIFNFFKNIF